MITLKGSRMWRYGNGVNQGVGENLVEKKKNGIVKIGIILNIVEIEEGKKGRK